MLDFVLNREYNINIIYSKRAEINQLEDIMNLTQTVVQLCSRLNVTMAELSRRTKQSPQNLCRKIKNETISYDEFLRILEALGVKYEYTLALPGEENPCVVQENNRVKERMSLMEAELDLSRRTVQLCNGILRDIRAALYTIGGNTDIAAKNLKNTARVSECLRKIRTTNKQVEALLNDAVTGQEPAADRPAESVTTASFNPEAVRGHRVLVVDDNQFNREIARDTLEDNGLIAEECSGGIECLEKIKNAPAGYYSCILMDVQMPDMDGLEAARHIRAIPNRAKAGVPIIAMTANAFDEDRRKSFEAGMDAHLIKPVDGEKMIRTLAKFI